ncbi:putative glycerophosphodiester phosphodiesterase YPL206C [Saccharomyces pastorianus]|uniref:Putative glycerophosphodiester phosphodiesterase YPL206C n=1 Tax=Saccharomyces pastorianus TaxID=27292 RepID=A0A6C1E1A6_SACPS|nr:putative glycerophosphodiester phosphodiesterase YPL206C [Saccharomyces pastorianus]
MVEIVGHRAFKARYPENTLLAFEKAYAAGADVIETDLQMTSDGMMVVNHDSDTGRMWDKNLVIGESTWEEVKRLRCKEDGSLAMMTLKEILTWAVCHPGAKLMLDIKFTNEKIIMIKTFAIMLEVKNDLKFWQERITWGLWLLDWYDFGIETGVLKDFKVIVISLSLDIASQFVKRSLTLNDPHYKLFGISVHFVSSWTSQFRLRLLPVLMKNDIKVYLWTVNKPIDFKYLCELPIHGAITDDPIKARKLCDGHTVAKKPTAEKKFVAPSLASVDGLRFHAFIKVYNILCTLLYSKWVHIKLCGWSIAYVIFLFLRTIHFL